MTIDINDPVTVAAKADIFAVLDTSPNEVQDLLCALREGRVEGRLYEGECCCLVGTLAKAAGLTISDIPYRNADGKLRGKLARDPDAPSEMWFWDIQLGDDGSERLLITVAWVEEWMSKRAEISK